MISLIGYIELPILRASAARPNAQLTRPPRNTATLLALLFAHFDSVELAESFMRCVQRIFTTHTVMKINQEQKVKIHIL